MLKRTIPVALMALVCVAASGWAHLCNDVFIQAKDNLAVKVDIRDGQLRIGKEASFNVYLLNTMDRAIVDIRLEVVSPHFSAKVKPDATWRSFPALNAVRRGGKKQYFTVTLQRNSGVGDGRYKISLHLFNGKNKSMSFKTVDLEAAAGIVQLPKAPAITVDGQGAKEEWQEAFLIYDEFYYYRKAGRYMENVSVPVNDRPRVRFLADASNLYCLFYFRGDQPQQATLYVAPDSDSTPVKVTFDSASGSVQSSAGAQGVECRKSADKPVLECKIPRSAVGLDGRNAFYANFVCRPQGGGKSDAIWWRGNEFSENDPIVYGHFRIAD